MRVAPVFTYCPAPQAVTLAHRRGLLDPALRFIADLPATEWRTHYTHEHPALLRCGGHIPSIWARGAGKDTVLLGTYFLHPVQVIVARKDDRGEGMRFALPRCAVRGGEIDFLRAAALRGYDAYVEAAGIDRTRVTNVDVVVPDPLGDGQVARHGAPAGGTSIWAEAGLGVSSPGAMVRALVAGEVDRVHVAGYRAVGALDAAGVESVFDLHVGPTRTSAGSGYEPCTITATRALVEERRDLVVGFLEALVVAAEEAIRAPEAAVSLLATAGGVSPATLRRAFDIPTLAELAPLDPREGLGILATAKDFFVREGLVRDFDLAAWADGSLLEEARANVAQRGAARVAR